MTFDAVRGRAVLFGGATHQFQGLLSDTWEWDGTTWSPALPATSPGSLGSGLAYDSFRGRTVLLGWRTNPPLPCETWEWDGTDWSRRFPSASPPARSYTPLAYDPARRRTVLFGGTPGPRGGVLGDTWEWEGSNWVQAFPATSPPPQAWHALVYDAARGRTLLTGYGSAPSIDHWEWDGVNWVQRFPSPAPPFRAGHAMAYDAARVRVVLFGGAGLSQSPLSDTWEWDGNAWTALAPATSPPGRFGHGMAYDVARARTVLFGGIDGNQSPLSDTWEWDGADWRQRITAASPPVSAYDGQGLAYDAVRRRLLYFGVSHALWQYSAAWDTIGPGHPGGGLPMICIDPPRVGIPFCLVFDNPSPSRAGFNLLLAAAGPPLAPPLTISLPGVCVPAFLHLIPRLVFSAQGNPALFCLPVPPAPALAGLPISLQGASLETGVCFRATDAVVATVQP